jgi:phospholipid transport system substrate-binding protein
MNYFKIGFEMKLNFLKPNTAFIRSSLLVFSCAFSVLTIAIMPSSLQAATALYCKNYDTPEAFVSHIGQEVINTLTDKSLTDSQKTEKFTTMLHDAFDLRYIGRFVLGRNYRTATPAQREEYFKLFERMLENIYSDRFDNYTGETLTTLGLRAVSDTDSIVTGKVQRNDGAPPVQIEWRIRSRDTGCKIIDILVEGVSMSLTQRQEFNSYIQQNSGSFEALLAEMRRKYGNS